MSTKLTFHEAARRHEAGEHVQYLDCHGEWQEMGPLLQWGCWTEGPFRIVPEKELETGYRFADGTGVDAEGALVWYAEASEPCVKGRPDLFPPKALQVAGQVLAFGEGKHPDEKWRAMSSAEHMGATWRHLLEHQAGNTYDSESGELHLAYALVRLGMALDRYLEFR